MNRRTRLAPVVVASLLLVVLGGCAAPPAAPPPNISVSVFQYRSDYAIRQLELEVANRGKADVTVTSATFSSPTFGAHIASRYAPSPVFFGEATDFPIVLPQAHCDVAPGRATVNVTLRTASGAIDHVTAHPPDPFNSLGTVRAQDCSLAAFEKVAKITIAPQLRFGSLGGKPLSLLDVTITPTGASGSVTLRSIGSTTLLQQPAAQLRVIDETFTSASKPSTIAIAYVPSRCEQHVVGEDKVGTLLPVRVDAGEYRDALFLLSTGTDLKIQYYHYVARYCGW